MHHARAPQGGDVDPGAVGRRQSACATGTQIDATTQTAASASSSLCAAAAWRMTGTIASKTPAATAARALASLLQLK
jgi:hypothetical protein